MHQFDEFGFTWICGMLLACRGELLASVSVGVVIGTLTFQSLVLGSLVPLRIVTLLHWIVMLSLLNVASHPLSQNSSTDDKFLSAFLKWWLLIVGSCGGSMTLSCHDCIRVLFGRATCVRCCVGMVGSVGLQWKKLPLAPVLAIVVMAVEVLFWVRF